MNNSKIMKKAMVLGALMMISSAQVIKNRLGGNAHKAMAQVDASFGGGDNTTDNFNCTDFISGFYSNCSGYLPDLPTLCDCNVSVS